MGEQIDLVANIPLKLNRFERSTGSRLAAELVMTPVSPESRDHSKAGGKASDRTDPRGKTAEH